MKLGLCCLFLLLSQPLEGNFIFHLKPSAVIGPRLKTINTLDLLLERSQKMGIKPKATFEECLKLPGISLVWYFFGCNRVKIPSIFFKNLKNQDAF